MTIKCRWCQYPLIFAVRWIDFFPTESDPHKLPVCDVCWKDIGPKYTCAFDTKCKWPAPRLEVGSRINSHCNSCDTILDCVHGWSDWLPVCSNHLHLIDKYVEEESKRRGY